MSQIEKVIPGNETGLSHIIKTESGDHFYVDTSNTLDHGWETMSFPYDDKESKVSNWNETYAEWYDTEAEAVEGHFALCENYEAKTDDESFDVDVDEHTEIDPWEDTEKTDPWDVDEEDNYNDVDDE